jgi:hypothetical protein
MQVIFCHIPARVSLNELFLFAESGVRPFLPFSRKPRVLDCEILEITHPKSLSQEFHGLVTFASPALAERAIRTLNGRKLGGKPITVRAYVHRRPGDRRVHQDTSGLNRPEDQRRQDLKTQKRREDHVSIKAYNAVRVHDGHD